MLLHLILNHISDGRLIRIIGNDGHERYVPLVRQAGFEKFDTVVSEAPDSPTERENLWLMLQQAIPFLVPAGVPLPPAIIDFLPHLPVRVREQWKALLQPQPPGPAEQLALAKQEADVDAKSAQAEASRAKAFLDLIEGQVKAKQMDADQATHLIDAMLKRQNLEMQERNLAVQDRNAELDFASKAMSTIANLAKLKEERQKGNGMT